MTKKIKIIAGFLILFALYHAAEYFVLFQYNPWMFLFVQACFLLAAFLIARWQGFGSLSAWGLSINQKSLIGFLVGALSGFMLYFVAYLVCLITGIEKTEGIPSVREFLPKLLLFGFGVFFSSLSEDILTRGYLYKHLGNRLSPVPLILFSATVYLFNHIYRLTEGTETMIYIFLLGVLLVIPVLITRRLWLTVGMHWMGNATFFLTHSVFNTSGGKETLSPNTIFIFIILLFIPLIIRVSQMVNKVHPAHTTSISSLKNSLLKLKNTKR